MGGAEKRFSKLLHFWSQQSIDVSVVESKPSLLCGLEKFREHRLLSTLSLPGHRGWFSVYFEWLLWMIKGCIFCLGIGGKENYDVIITSNNNIPNIIPGYFISRIRKIPLCVIVHHIEGLIFDNAGMARVYSTSRFRGFGRLLSVVRVFAVFVITTILRKAEICIAVSRSTAKILISFGVPRCRVHVSGNGVDIEYIDSFPAPQEKIYDAVFVGRISKEKGVYDLIDVWFTITGKKKDAKLVIIGSGPELHNIRETVRKRKLVDNVEVKGPCTDSEMYRLIKSSRLFIFPSLFEGWGLAVAEALACGLPVICYDIPSLREVFGKCKSVFFTPIKDLDALQLAIINLLERKDFQDLAIDAKSYVEKFSWKDISRRDLDIIHSRVYKL